MKNPVNVVYGGSFDPFTMGHVNVIKKIMTFADKLYVVVATNPDKKPMFSDNEKKILFNDYVETHFPNKNIVIDFLPSNEFLAKYAESVNAQLMVRGLRDTIDFTFEQKIDSTNKKIASDVETIYVMPDAQYALTSSSWVKSMVGIFGWQEVLSDAVSDLTIAMLEEKWLKKEFERIFNETKRLNLITPLLTFDEVWGVVKKSYDIPYHNLSHIVRMMEACHHYYAKEINRNSYVRLLVDLAIIFHDIEDSEFHSFAKADSILNFSDNTVSVNNKGESHHEYEWICPYVYFKKLIMATMHSAHSNLTEMSVDETMMASCDLIILSSPEKEYKKYVAKVKKEYRFKEDSKNLTDSEFDVKWKEGRAKFLDSMLSRFTIFPSNTVLSFDFEIRARENLVNEIKSLLNT